MACFMLMILLIGSMAFEAEAEEYTPLTDEEKLIALDWLTTPSITKSIGLLLDFSPPEVDNIPNIGTTLETTWLENWCENNVAYDEYGNKVEEPEVNWLYYKLTEYQQVERKKWIKQCVLLHDIRQYKALMKREEKFQAVCLVLTVIACVLCCILYENYEVKFSQYARGAWSYR